jgi:hypothetical protein
MEPAADEQVSLASGTDLGTTGLVLTAGTTSPAVVSIDGGGRVIDLTGAASGSPLITVGSGVTLTLKNITLMGLKAGDGQDTADNTAPVIKVDGGNLVMGDGAVIRGNTASGGGGGGGAAAAAGGVYMASGEFTMMSGAIISGNTGSGGAGGNGGGYGSGGGGGGGGAGGVYVTGGEFTMMSGASISGNTGSGGAGGDGGRGWTATSGNGGGAVTMKANAAIGANTGSQAAYNSKYEGSGGSFKEE